MAHWFADLRYALRSLRAAPLFTAIAVVSIAVGIAANTTVFTLVDQVVLRALPVTRPGELVQLTARGTESFGGGTGDGSELSYAMYRDLHDRNDVFAGMFCRFPNGLHASDGTRSEVVAGELVSGSFFPQLGVKPAVGRLIVEDDDRRGGGRAVAVLGYRYWRSRFNGDASVVGRTVNVNGHPFEIIGVAQAGFEGLDIGQPTQLYVPIAMQPQLGPSWLQIDTRRFRWVQVFGRLRDGMTAEKARAGIQPLYQSLLREEATESAFASASPETKRRFLEGALTVVSAARGRSGLRESVREPLLILMAIAGAVLLIVCANVANLLIARGAGRHRELALRLAIGAGRQEIVRLLLIESLMLAIAGAAAGLVLASWGAGVLLGFFATPENPLAVSPDPDARIVAFTAALAIVTALLAGVMPALRSTRVDLAPALKGSGGGVLGGQPRLRKTLVVAQVALSFILLIGAGLFLRSLDNLLRIDPGFGTSRTMTFSFDLEQSGYDGERAHAFATTFIDRVTSVPGVASATYAFQSLLEGGGWSMGLTIEGYQVPQGSRGAGAVCNAIGPGFFKAMGIPLLLGREFDARDDRVLPAPEGWPYRHAVVNETFVKRYFKGANPIGRHVGLGSEPGTPTPIEIVGVVKDTKAWRIREDIRPQIFFPYLQAGQIEGVTVYVRTDSAGAGPGRGPEALMPSIRRAFQQINPRIAINRVATLDERVEASVTNERLIASLSATLSTMATVLSLIGLYGVMAYMVTRRTREIGIRMALGARAMQVAAGILREAGLLVTTGLAIGFGAAWWLGRFIQSQLYQVAPADAATILLAALALTIAASLAVALPARRASRVSPMAALRDQ